MNSRCLNYSFLQTLFVICIIYKATSLINIFQCLCSGLGIRFVDMRVYV